MTADAKVGLLLGLFFIVVIAFLINGLPNFLHSEQTASAPQTAVTPPAGPDLVIDQRLTETATRLSPTRAPLRVSQPPQDVVVLSQTAQTAEPITLAPLPSPVATPTETSPTPPPPALMPQETPVIVRQAETLPSLPEPQPQPAAARNDANAQIHIVQKGESLASIAQKYYGAQEGSRASAIQRLYEANKDILESPDKIQAGHKLVIPNAQKQQKTTASQTLLQKFSDLIERQPTPAAPKTQEKPLSTEKPAEKPAIPTQKTTPTPKVVEYTVQKGDTLWKIAERTLGDGHKMGLLIELNKDQLKNPDDIRVGMKLRVPAP